MILNEVLFFILNMTGKGLQGGSVYMTRMQVKSRYQIHLVLIAITIYSHPGSRCGQGRPRPSQAYDRVHGTQHSFILKCLRWMLLKLSSTCPF